MSVRSLVVRALLVALLLPVTTWRRCACDGPGSFVRLTAAYNPADGQPLRLRVSSLILVRDDSKPLPLITEPVALRFAGSTGEEALLAEVAVPPGRYRLIRITLDGISQGGAAAGGRPESQAFSLDTDLALAPGSLAPLLLELQTLNAATASPLGAETELALILVPRDQAATVAGSVGPLSEPQAATVTLTHTGTGSAVTVHCTAASAFRLVVPAGTYDLVAAAPGGHPFHWPALEVYPNESKRLGPLALIPAVTNASDPDPRLFLSPPRAARRLDYLLQNQLPGMFPILDALGAGGVVTRMHPQEGGRYLLEEAGWANMKQRLAEARRRRMRVWIYDEWEYPSGYAGGLTLEGHPELQAQGVLAYSLEASPPRFDQALPRGRLLRVVALRKDRPPASLRALLDLTGYARAGRLLWQPPPGSWQVVALVQQPLFEGTHGQATCGAYPNLLDPRFLPRFLQLTHQQYYARFPDFFGKEIEAFFSDEPSLQCGFTSKGPAPAIPWVDDLPQQFRSRTGRDLLGALPALFYDLGAETTPIRCAFYSLISDLLVERYFAPLTQWCEQRGVHNAVHLFQEESLPAHVAYEGSAFAAGAASSWPGIDWLGAWVIGEPNRILGPKTASSAAHLYGKQVVWSEAFATAPARAPFHAVMGSIAAQAVLGVDTFVTMPPIEESSRTYSPEQYFRLNNYCGRISYLLRGSRHDCEVAILYPIASVWSHYVPSATGAVDEFSPRAAATSDTLAALSQALLKNQVDFDYLDEQSLVRAGITEGALSLADHRFRWVFLPAATTLSRASVRSLDRFLAQGGNLVVVGDPPSESSERGPDAWVSARAARWLALPNCVRVSIGQGAAGALGVEGSGLQPLGVAVELPQSLAARLPHAVRLLGAPPRSEAIYAKRAARGGRGFVMLVNTWTEAAQLRLAAPFPGALEEWNPDTGRLTPLQVSPSGEVRLRIAPLRATFILSR